ncbi:signal recognition particle-docking protein FtsY [Corynebacterium sp. NML 150383]|uniref:signal recognition particle-docking protein FtsY n=1 Tax=Corynebacterium sp. NML 150383 TaxID=2029400 RepID=UPI000BAA3974|nr:signal recognition particle-docking protein FtsY [Corynebacterium sp. NML 150383]
MNSPLLWIIVAIIVVVLIIVGIVVVGRRRKEEKTVSFEKTEEPKELTQQEKSGNYQAKGGFNFAPAAAPDAPAKEPVKEPVLRDEPAAPVAKEEPKAAAAPTPEPVAEPVEEPVAEPVEEPAQNEAPVEAADRDTSNPSDPSDSSDTDETVVLNTDEPETSETVVAPEDVAPTEPTEPTEQETEATEAAEAAAVTAESADAAREAGAEPSDDVVVEKHDAPAEELDEIEPATGRIGKLRGRLSRSQNAIGQGLLGILTAGDLDEDAWEEIEDTLIMADLGANLTMKVTENLREKIAERGVSTEAEARAMLRETLIEAARPDMDRSIKAMPNEGKPAVILVAGVNGTGKTTTTGKLARVLVSMGHSVVLGAADTFRAAAADQLETWGRRVGASTVRGKEGADPASVAFDAVATGVQEGADVVLIDTAGRLHTSTDLMDQLGKVKRVVEKKSNVDEVLLVLDATVGQNGIAQARVFREVVDITGVVLTKLDGTAKGGIVFQVQEELGVPVKLVGLGEGADDLAPFEVESFVDALLG